MGDMKKFHVVSFLCGAAVMLGFSTLRGSDPSHHNYELRMYHVRPGKIDALKARFGDAPSSQNLFIYILEHPSREEAERNWSAFQADPEWKKVKAESEANGPLVDHIDRYFMDPTGFSALN